MNKPIKVEAAHVFPCKMSRIGFLIFRAALFIYFAWFILNVLLSKFPSPGELIYNISEYLYVPSKVMFSDYYPQNFK